MKVIQVYLKNSLRNFNYILYSEKTKDAIFFDPADLAMTLPISKKLGLTPKYLINTHQHWDHVADNEKFLSLPHTQHLKLQDEEEFKLSDTEKIIALHTPGHVMDHYCYLLVENGKEIGLISGDAIFNAGIGNCKNGGSPEVSYETMKNIFNHLGEQIIIYPSHDYFINNLQFAKTIEPNNKSIDEYLGKVQELAKEGKFYLSTIAEEKKYNPFFRALNPEYSGPKLGTDKENFVKLRQMRDRW